MQLKAPTETGKKHKETLKGIIYQKQNYNGFNQQQDNLTKKGYPHLKKTINIINK